MVRRAKIRSIPLGLALITGITVGFAADRLVVPAVGGEPAATSAAAEVPKPARVINPGPLTKVYDRKLEYVVFNKNCTQCHVSVADPERPGKTRDEWYRIVNLMQEHGLTITQEEADMIVDLLFKLRKGVEEHAG